MKLHLIFAMIVLAASFGHSLKAVELVRYDLAGQPGTQVSNSPEYVDPCVTGLNLTRSPGLAFTTPGNNSMNSSNWAIGEYYSFGFTVNAGFQANLTNLEIGTRSSTSGPRFLVLYCSADGFTNPIATIDHSPGNVFVNSNINLSSLTGLTGTVEFRLRVDQNVRALDGTSTIASNGTNRVTNFFAPTGDPPVNTDTGGFRVNGTCSPISGGASVVGAFVHHFGYTGSGSPVDTVKSMHKEGATPQALIFNNLINSSRGINGVAFDIQNLGNGGSLSASDFQFQVSPTGAFSQPTVWSPGPSPVAVTVTPGSPDRVTIQWANNAIANRWLRITILATANTGLSQSEVYYVGHLLGETTGVESGFYTVSFSDITPIRGQSGATVDSGSIHDIDKSGTVSFADISAMRPNVGAQLTNITVP